MLPVIALIGNTNVGKSTLFNRLTRQNASLVDDTSGLTRDRQYGELVIQEKRFIIIDTAGFVARPDNLEKAIIAQSEIAIEEADIIFFMVDCRAGISVLDEEIAQKLRSTNKPIYFLPNKIDGASEAAINDCYRLGFENIFPISSTHGRGVAKLVDAVYEKTASSFESFELPPIPPDTIKIAIVGRPNVGKSTLVNRMLGEERVVVFDMPGTTRDSIYIPFTRQDSSYVLVDTAGIRRRKSIRDRLEKIAIIKTLQAIDAADVVIQVLDARESVVDQDLHLMGYILEKGRSLILAINKWDGLEFDAKTAVKSALDRRLTFVDFAPIRFISALHGTGVGHLFDDVKKCFASIKQKWSTKQLTGLLQQFTTQHQPPMVSGRRIKLRFAHLGGNLPPLIIIHGNQTENVPEHYRRYLSKSYQSALRVIGTPVKIEFKTGENPFEGRKNPLTPRQQKKRQRLVRFVKKQSRKHSR